MHDVSAMAVCDPGRNASHDESCFGFWYGFAHVDVVQKISVLRDLEHEVDLLWGLDQAKDSQDIRMAEFLKSVHLSRQKLCEKLLGRPTLFDDLDGNLNGEKKRRRDNMNMIRHDISQCSNNYIYFSYTRKSGRGRGSPFSSRRDTTLPSLWRRFQSQWSSRACS